MRWNIWRVGSSKQTMSNKDREKRKRSIESIREMSLEFIVNIVQVRVASIFQR
jgi:hypothetical protein